MVRLTLFDNFAVRGVWHLARTPIEDRIDETKRVFKLEALVEVAETQKLDSQIHLSLRHLTTSLTPRPLVAAVPTD